MRVVVTGAAGFTGRYLLARLRREHEVFAVTRQRPEWPKKADAVIHTAARVSAAGDAELRAENLATLDQAIDAARRAGVSRFVYFSSSSVYRRPVASLPVEETATTGPVTDYSWSKLEGEEHLSAEFPGSWCALRCSSIYGPGQKPGSVLPSFLLRVLAGQPPVIDGTGERSQDFVHVADVAAVAAACLVRPAEGVFNIGSGEETTMLELARLMIHQFAGHTMEPQFRPAMGALERFVLDIRRARRELQFTPRTLREGLKRYSLSIGVPA